MLIAEISISNNEAWWDENKNQWDDNENTGCKQIHRLVTLIWKRNLRQTAKLLPRLPLAVHRTTICFKMWPAFTAHFQLNRLFTTSFTVWLILHCWLCCITLPDQNYFSECIVIMSDKIYVQNYKKKGSSSKLGKNRCHSWVCVYLYGALSLKNHHVPSLILVCFLLSHPNEHTRYPQWATASPQLTLAVWQHTLWEWVCEIQGSCDANTAGYPVKSVSVCLFSMSSWAVRQILSNHLVPDRQ